MTCCWTPRRGLARSLGTLSANSAYTTPHDQPPLIKQQTEFAADNPPVIREAFAANLLGAPAFTHGMNQLDPIRVDDPEHGRGGQESPRPVLMGHEETKELGALGKPRKQRPIIAC